MFDLLKIKQITFPLQLISEQQSFCNKNTRSSIIMVIFINVQSLKYQQNCEKGLTNYHKRESKSVKLYVFHKSKKLRYFWENTDFWWEKLEIFILFLANVKRFCFTKVKRLHPMFHKSEMAAPNVSQKPGIYRRLASVKQICFTTDKSLEFLCPSYFSMSNQFHSAFNLNCDTKCFNLYLIYVKILVFICKWIKSPIDKENYINERNNIFNIIITGTSCVHENKNQCNKEEDKKCAEVKK